MTDTKMAYQASLEAAEICSATILISVLPPLWFGYTMAMLKNLPGTVTIRPRVPIGFLSDMCRSFVDIFPNSILVVNGYGNNPGVRGSVARTAGHFLE